MPSTCLPYLVEGSAPIPARLDTPYDVEAAQRAGIPIIAVRCGGWKDRDLEGAVGVYDDPADILANYDRVFP